MRLRKNMKRTAAAVLALSMAVSAVAAPASAAYICNVSQGSVEVSVDSEGNKTIKVGDDSVTIKTDGTKETTGNGIKEDGDGTEDIVITGDNTKPAPTESLRLKSPARPRPRARIRPRTLPPRVRTRAMSPPLRSCWPRRTSRRRLRRRRTSRSPPKRRRRSRTKRPKRPPIR